MMPDENSNSSTLSSSALYRDLRKEYESLFTLKEGSGLEISPIFNVLPPKKDYPDYYAVIKNPVSFNTLKKRIPHYTDAQHLYNTEQYNEILYHLKQLKSPLILLLNIEGGMLFIKNGVDFFEIR